MPSDAPPPVHEFDQIERVTRLVARSALVFVPLWILLLATLPFATGLGPLACLSLATLVAGAAVVLVERRRARRAPAPAADAPRRERGPMSPLAAAGLTLGAVALLAYVIFVIQAA